MSEAEDSTEDVAAAATVAIGVGAVIAGKAALATAKTGMISAAGAAAGGTIGGVIGSSIGLATGGAGMAATVPGAILGASIGGYAGLALALVGIGTAPVWAMPLVIGGACTATVGIALGLMRFLKRRR
jgi:hypothetical protein